MNGNINVTAIRKGEDYVWGERTINTFKILIFLKPITFYLVSDGAITL